MFLLKYPQIEFQDSREERAYALVATLAQESDAETIYVSNLLHSPDGNRIRFLFLTGQERTAQCRFLSLDPWPESTEPDSVYVFADTEAFLFPEESYSVSLYDSVGIAYSK
jgi:hypothetical protein